jgi:hypothetical protein
VEPGGYGTERAQIEPLAHHVDVTTLDGGVDGVVLRLAADGPVVGTVVDASGRPVQGAAIQQLRTVNKTAPSDASGRFSWTPVGDPPYTLVATTADGREGLVSVLDRRGAAPQIHVGETGTLIVRCDAFAATSIDVSVDHYGVQPHCNDRVALLPGTYEVLGRDRDGHTMTTVATVARGRTTDVQFPERRSINVRVRLALLGDDPPDADPWCSAAVSTAVGPYLEVDRGARTSGEDVMLAVPPGPTRISCTDAMGYAPARREISAARDQVATIPLVPVEINGVELGVELREVLDGALVVGVADEAAAAGLRVGDVVTAVGDTNVAGMNPESVHELGFRVPPGNEVSWTVKRRTAELTLHARAPGPKTRPLYRR